MEGDRSTDFFISYTGADRNWAEWIAWQLDHAGFTVLLQAWDFTPGRDFVHEMERAMSNSRRTIALLSESYVSSPFGEAEWRSAFAKDPTGEKGVLVPVKVAPCNPPELLRSRVYIDLTGMEADEAKNALLVGLRGEGTRPSREPSFPGHSEVPPMFPGDTGQRHAPLRALDGARIQFPTGKTAVYFPSGLDLAPGAAVESDRYLTVRELLDDLYVGYLSRTFPPFSYGERWVLFDQNRCIVPIAWLSAIGAPIRSIAEAWQDTKPSDAGIRVNRAITVSAPTVSASASCWYYGAIADDDDALAFLAENPKAQYELIYLRGKKLIATLDHLPSNAEYEGVFMTIYEESLSGQIFDLRGRIGADWSHFYRLRSR